MSEKCFKDKEVIIFSRKLPTCPKCGGKTKRYYSYHQRYADYNTALEGLEEGEYFEVCCLECSYEFPQHVKEDINRRT